MIKRRTEIIIETHEVFLVRNSRRSPGAWCDECAVESGMLSAEEVAAFCGVSARELSALIATRRIHFKETGAGELSICLRSLATARAFGAR